MADQNVFKTVEDVMKWTIAEKDKVMLVRNIVNGDLKLADPELVAYLKAQIFQIETPKLETPKPNPDLSDDVLHYTSTIVTNMVAFNGHICFTLKDNRYFYHHDVSSHKNEYIDIGSNNITCLAAGNGYLYSGDDQGQILVWDINWKVVSRGNIPDKFHVTAMYAVGGKLYVGNNQGQLYMFDSEGTNRVSYSTQLPNRVTHIIKFNKFLVWASERKFHLESLDESDPKHYGAADTAGNIRLLTIENETLSVYTTAGRIQVDSHGAVCRRDGTYEMYGTYYNNFYCVLNHKGRILNACEGVIFDIKGNTIVSHTPPKIGNNDHIVAVIHNDKLYSSGADYKIKVTNL